MAVAHAAPSGSRCRRCSRPRAGCGRSGSRKTSSRVGRCDLGRVDRGTPAASAAREQLGQRGRAVGDPGARPCRVRRRRRRARRQPRDERRRARRPRRRSPGHLDPVAGQLRLQRRRRCRRRSPRRGRRPRPARPSSRPRPGSGWSARSSSRARSRMPQDVLPQVRPVLRVEPGGRLVQEQQRRRVHQAHRHVEPAPLTAGQARTPCGRPASVRSSASSSSSARRRGGPPVEAVDQALAVQLVARRAGCGRRRCPGRRSRSAGGPGRVASTTSCPATVAVPRVGAMSVVSIRIVVVLPAPFGPSTATSSPGSMSRLMPRTACTVSGPADHEVLGQCSGAGSWFSFGRCDADVASR